MIRDLDAKPRLTLEDVTSALNSLKEQRGKILTDVEVLFQLASDKRVLAKKVAGNKDLLKKFGNEEEILSELDALSSMYEDQIHTIAAAKKFEEKAEGEGWGSWAFDKIKSAVSFPVRHPIIALLMLAAIAGGTLSYLGYLPELSLPLAKWFEKLKSLLKFGGAGVGGATEAAKDAMTIAREAYDDVAVPMLRTFGRQVGYGGKVYEMDELPSLLESLPELKAGADGISLKILRDPSSKATLEAALRDLLRKKGVDELMIDWGDGPLP